VPLVIAYPSELWQPGDVWRGLHTFHVPGRLNAGDYDVVLDLYDAGVEPVVIGRMQVSTPPRRFELPEIESPVDVVWQNGIHLLGYDLSTLSGETIDLRLIWQPEDELNISLRFFAHLLDTDERIVAQVDGVPVEWTRPTTGWAPGEVITEALTLTVPDESTPGEYTLRLGWYDPLTGDRVRLDDGDFWTLPVTIPLIGS
jgi:hypothetical protein